MTSEQKLCEHVNVTVVGDGIFQSCDDCGAVRSRVVGRFNQYNAWHVCDLCRLPGSVTSDQRGFLDMDGVEWWCAALIVALVILAGFGIRESIREQREWRAWAAEHACKVIGHMEGSTDVGVGPSTGSNGGVAVVTTTTPSKTGYQCDDGMTYWRNN